MFANKKPIIIVFNNPNFYESRLESSMQWIIFHREYIVDIDWISLRFNWDSWYKKSSKRIT